MTTIATPSRDHVTGRFLAEPQAWKPCERCGQLFTAKRPVYLRRRRFCSKRCFGLVNNPSRNASKPCRQCGEPIAGPPSLVAKRQFCSMKCMGLQHTADGWSGEKSANYVHGRARTPEYVRETRNRWAKNHPDKVRLNNRNNRARRRNVEGVVTEADLEVIWKRQKGRCVYCRNKMTRLSATLDHIKPIVRGGTNWPHNLQFLCAPCNFSKKDRPAETYARSLGWLL